MTTEHARDGDDRRTHQVRIYTLRPGSAAAFLRWWRSTMPPLRHAFGFDIDFAYLSEDETSFVWSVSAPGSAEEFRMLEQRYEASPERARALADAPPVAARTIMLARRVG